MSPIRLIILAILFYILYRLLVGGRKAKVEPGSRQDDTGSRLASQDVLVEDPVCHTYIPKQQAVSLEQGDRTYHFCSEECCNKFVSEQKGANP